MIRVLHHHPNTEDATNYYRGMGMFNQIQRKHPGKFNIIDVQKLDLKWEFISRYDIFFFQRPASLYELSIIRLCKEYGIKTWVDFDDHYGAIPDNNPRKKYYTDYTIRLIQEIATLADVVTVSTRPIQEYFKKFNDQVVIIHNGVDTSMFDIMGAQEVMRTPIILYRGSDTHRHSWEYYEKAFIQLFNDPDLQDYIFGFMGDIPPFVLNHLVPERIKVYQPKDPIQYFNMLQRIRPIVTYVVLTDNEFDQARTCNGYIESTLAGSVCVAPRLPEWIKTGSIQYDTKDPMDIARAIKAAVSQDWSKDKRRAAAQVIHDYNSDIPNRFRMDIMQTLAEPSYLPLPKKEIPKPFTPKEFFDFHITHGWIMDNPVWKKGQEDMADYLIEKFSNMNRVIDLGCGSGSQVEVLNRKGVQAWGIDMNKYNKEYFLKRNPDLKDKYIWGNIVKKKVPGHFDVALCVEVFEHMEDKDIMSVLEYWHDKVDYFVFSSTPFADTPEFDIQWGHINVKQKAHWIRLFKYMKYFHVEDLEYPASWAMLFKPYTI